VCEGDQSSERFQETTLLHVLHVSHFLLRSLIICGVVYTISSYRSVKLKMSHYTPWGRLGEEEI
jgi:hypothetical protein